MGVVDGANDGRAILNFQIQGMFPVTGYLIPTVGIPAGMNP